MVWKHPRALPDGLLDLYVAHWRREGFVKVGITKNQRWRKFPNRGGTVIAVLRLPAAAARAVEVEIHDILSSRLECPFWLAREADRYLGSGGGGYTECYRNDGASVMPVVLEVASRLAWPYERVAV